MDPAEFHRRTSHLRRAVSSLHICLDRPPAPYKEYPGATSLALPNPEVGEGGRSLWTCVARRRSVRSFARAPLGLTELSQLLWASSGVTQVSMGHLLRASPSAGALYPIETYVAADRVEGLPAGLYHYRVAGRSDRHGTVPSHMLEQVRVGAPARALAEAALGQEFVGRAAAVFLWTAVYDRAACKYGDRAYRYICLEAGHMAAQLSLATVALGLVSCPVGAFYDDEVDKILGVDGKREWTVYLTAIGRSLGNALGEED